MNIRQVRTLAKHWQKVLGLQVWTIKIDWSKPKDHVDAFGSNHFEPNHQESHMRILHPRYYGCMGLPVPAKGDDSMVIATLIHELLHLSLFPLEAAAGWASREPTEHWDLAQEQLINTLAKALMDNTTPKEGG